MSEKDKYHPINKDGPLPFYAGKITPRNPSEIFLVRLDSIQDPFSDNDSTNDSSESGVKMYPSDVFEPIPGKEVRVLINGKQRLISYDKASKLAQER